MTAKDRLARVLGQPAVNRFPCSLAAGTYHQGACQDTRTTVSESHKSRPPEAAFVSRRCLYELVHRGDALSVEIPEQIASGEPHGSAHFDE
jgi:hypothetical protein